MQNQTLAHAVQDVTGAKSLGLDAFALDLDNPTADWASDSISSLFTAAQQNNFKIFFSLDFASTSTTAESFDPWLKQYLTHPAYYTTGTSNSPLLSTFHDGGLGPSGWSTLKQKYNNGNIYFMPNFDSLQNYYTNPASIVSQYSSVIDGLFNWETAWPPQQDHVANVSITSDTPVQSAAAAAKKAFMMPLSTFQYKNQAAYGNYYRSGDVVLTQRMEEILAMETAPDFVEVLTWNDAGESHYIGNVWPESMPPNYAAVTGGAQNEGASYIGNGTDHTAWQVLIASFVAAYKTGAKSSGGMAPIGNAQVSGALWYHPMTDGTICGDKPEGAGAVTDSINYGLILPDSCAGQGWSMKLTSGSGKPITWPLSPGLNYGSVPGIQAGAQSIQVLDGSGKAVGTASGGLTVPEGCGMCNFNYVVVGLK